MDLHMPFFLHNVTFPLQFNNEAFFLLCFVFLGITRLFKNAFFPSTIIEWNNLDLKIKNSESIKTFKKRILSFIRPSPNSTFNCHNPKGIKLLLQLRLGLCHLREHKFKHSFQDSFNPFCSCGRGEVETSSHYLLYCSNYLEE